MGKATNAGRLLIHILGGPALVAGLFHPPVEKATTWAWAKGKQPIPQSRLDELIALQEARK